MKQHETKRREGVASRGESVSDPTDRELIALIERGYRAPELGAARRARLDAELWDRAERGRSRRQLWIPAFAATALAAVLVWMAAPSVLRLGEPANDSIAIERTAAARSSVPPGVAFPVASEADAVARVATRRDAWEYALLFSNDPMAQGDDETESLPEDYRAIEDLFLAG